MKPISINRNLIIGFAALTVFILQNPFCILLPGTGDADSSWTLGLEWGWQKGLSIGDDIIFTYGPLHFLFLGVVDLGNQEALIAKSLIFAGLRLTALLLYVYALASMLRSQRFADRSWLEKVAIILAAIVVAVIPSHLTENLSIICVFILHRQIFDRRSVYCRQNVVAIILLAFLLAVLGLIKFSFTILAATLIIVGCVGFIINRRSRLIPLLISAFALFTVALWLLAEQPLTALPHYYSRGFQIAAGYSEGMMYNHRTESLLFYVVAVAFVPLCIYIFLRLLLKIKTLFREFFFCFMLAPVVFLAFKEGFVRMDLWHIYYFLSGMLPFAVFLLIFFIASSVGKRLKRQFAVLLCVDILLMFPLYFYAKDARFPVLATDPHPFSTLVSPDNDRTENFRRDIRSNNPPLSPEMLNGIGQNPVDIFPFDISLLWAYDLNWTPRPDFQSYAVVTSVPDSLNSMNFHGSNAVDRVIYIWKAFDGRYPAFYEPEVFRALLENYEPVTADSVYLLLAKKSRLTDYKYNTIAKGRSRMGELITVPDVGNRPLYCNIDIKPNLAGSLANLFYKTDFIFFNLFVEGESEPVRHTFTRRLGGDGLFVSTCIGNVSEFCEALIGNYQRRIEKLQFFTDHSNLFFEDEFEYEFYTATADEIP